MKKIYTICFSFLAFTLLLTSCQDDNLPKANFDLDAVTVFTAQEKKKKVDLAWETPTGKDKPEHYVLNWTPNGVRTVLDGTTNSYAVTGLKNGTNYKFTIQADYGSTGISGANEIKVVPKDELSFIVLPGNKIAIAKWNTPSRKDIANYTLSWSPNGQNVKIPVGTNSYQIKGLNNDAEYTFNLAINYADGTSSNVVIAKATPGNISAFLLNVPSPKANNLTLFTYNPAYLPGSTAVSWNWNFGDGGTSSEQNPQYKYTKPGIYDVSLQINDGSGGSYSDTRKVYVWGEKWSYQIGYQIDTQAPAIGADGTVYIGSANKTNFYAINPDGSLKWTYTGITDITYSSASIGSDGTIYVGSKDKNLHAINPNGTQKWKFNLGTAVIYSTPAIASDGTIYIGADGGKLFALNPNGTQKWAFSTPANNIRSTPAIANDGTVYVTSDDDNLYALNPSNGAVLWSFSVGGNAQSGIAIDSDGTIIVGVDQGGTAGAVFAVNPNGTKKWSITTTGRISVCAPAIANGTVYVGTKEGNNLLAFNASNGTQKWSFSTPGSIVNSSPAVDANGVIYFGSWDNNVYAINPDGTLKYKFLTGGIVWSAPTIGADGTIYIGGYDGKLHALEMFSGGLWIC